MKQILEILEGMPKQARSRFPMVSVPIGDAGRIIKKLKKTKLF